MSKYHPDDIRPAAFWHDFKAGFREYWWVSIATVVAMIIGWGVIERL